MRARLATTSCGLIAGWVVAASPPSAASAEDEGPAPVASMTAVFGGDTQFGRYERGRLKRHSSDTPLDGIADLFAGADLAFVNLENPVSDLDAEDLVSSPHPAHYTYRLRAPTKVLAGLAQIGIKVVSTANNHAADLGRDGLAMTAAALREAGLAQVGIAAEHAPVGPVEVAAAGGLFELFGATTFVNRPLDRDAPLALLSLDQIEAELAAKIGALRRAQPEALIIVSLHWGIEGAGSPRARHVRVAHALVDAGANAVVGHHAHVLQPIEIYKQGVIFYSLGNLLFDLPEVESRRSAVARVRWQHQAGGWQVDEVSLEAIERDPESPGPRHATPTEARRLLRRIIAESKQRFATELELEASHARWRRGAN